MDELRAIFLSEWMAVGIMMGIAIGAAMDNVAGGVGIGIALGAGLGETSRRRTPDDGQDEPRDREE